jgi:hypothetical protein
MSNRWTTLTIVPQLGGRLMQVNVSWLSIHPEDAQGSDRGALG